jgi:hypothetical protein
MSEYQYYEFLAVDRPLDEAAQEALREISSRGRITATSFINHYEWGDLKGDPREFMEQWFDLHLYFTNWGTRRLMMRVPARFLDRAGTDAFLRQLGWVEVWTSGDTVIVDIFREEVEDYDGLDDGSGWLATLAPLRGDVLSGDLRLFYLLWLAAVQEERVADDEPEPLPGIGPLTGALEAFAEFFCIDADLVQVAAERGADLTPSRDDLREALAAIPDREKTELLVRVAAGDALVAAELRKKFREAGPGVAAPRTAGTLRRQAQELAEARERAAAERREAEQRQRAERAEKERRAYLQSIRQRGEQVWREIESEIERRSPPAYDRAAGLLSDLQVLAVEEGSEDEFKRRLDSIRTRHEKKGRFIERLTRLGERQ